jgi:hypothetical protein
VPGHPPHMVGPARLLSQDSHHMQNNQLHQPPSASSDYSDVASVNNKLHILSSPSPQVNKRDTVTKGYSPLSRQQTQMEMGSRLYKAVRFD